MLIALCSILAIAVVALAVVNIKMRARLDEYVALDEQRAGDLEVTKTELRTVSSSVDEATRERDEALERVQRARRDAVEVANRLRDATTRTEELTTANRDLEARNDGLDADLTAMRRRLDEVERATAATPTPSDETPLDGELLWALTLARVDRLWRVSVAAGVDATSPLMTSDSLLADAIAIEVTAAREEAGALIEFTYEGHGDVDGMAATTTVALVEELVAGVVQADGEAELTVAVADDAVVVSLTATRDGHAVEIPGPAELVDGEGRYRIERTRRTADAG